MSDRNKVRIADILRRKFEGETYRKIHSNHNEITYETLVGSAREARHAALKWVSDGQKTPVEIANYYNVSKECVEAMIAQATLERADSDARYEQYENGLAQSRGEFSDLLEGDPIVSVALPTHQWLDILAIIDRCEGYSSFNEQQSIKNARDTIHFFIKSTDNEEMKQ